MQPAPLPDEWEAPLEDTTVDAHVGADGLWHVGVSAPGWHPYVATACGADLPPGPAAEPLAEGRDWSMDLGRVNCGTCTDSPWKLVTL